MYECNMNLTAVCPVWRIMNCGQVVFLMRTKRIKSQIAHCIPFVWTGSHAVFASLPLSLSCCLIASGADAGINNPQQHSRSLQQNRHCMSCSSLLPWLGEQANISAIENILLLRGAAQILSLKVPNRQVLLDSIFLRLLQTLVLNKRVIFLSFEKSILSL